MAATETRCTCGQGHATFGACVRAKNIRTSHVDRAVMRGNERELDLYAHARQQGVKPAGTNTAAIRYALDRSDETGTAFDATKPGG